MIILMKRPHLGLGFLICLFLALFLFWQAGRIIETQTTLRSVVITVDPGHGGVDGGCGSGTWQEKNVNLAIGLTLRDFLRQAGIRTLITRTRDTALETDLRPGRHRRDLSQRVRLFKQATLFVSIHCDWSKDTQRSGPSVFYRYSRPDSKRLGETIQNALNEWAHQKRRAESGNYFILKNAAPPGVIVEAGFLSNPSDRARLQDPKYRSALAGVVGRGVLGYLKATSHISPAH